MNRALVYDLEIIKAIPDRDGVRAPGIEYCAGWDDHANMGISVLVAYDYVEGQFRIFCQDNLSEFAALAADRAPLVGFNSINFDNKVLSANGIVLPTENCYDILDEIWLALGRRMKGYGLDQIARANLPPGMVKSGHGADAPVWWQQGQIGKVIDYCATDTLLTKKVLDVIIEKGGSIIDPQNTSRTLRLRAPVLGEVPQPVFQAGTYAFGDPVASSFQPGPTS